MNFMEKITRSQLENLSAFIDARGRKADELRRGQAILLLSQGAPSNTIKMFTGLARETAVKLRKEYIKHGIEILTNKRQEKKPRALLTKKERDFVLDILNKKTPRNYGWEWDYWTPGILASVIRDLYGAKYKSKTSLYLIFKEAKFTYHKPEKIYKNRNQEAIEEWRKRVAPQVKAALADPDTVVLVEDEMILTSQTTLQKIWLPAGVPATIECANTRKRRSIYGFLDIKTGTEYAFKAERQTSEISAKMLKKILALFPKKNVLLLWDNAPWHFGKAMKAFLDTVVNLYIVNFPTYAPEENPQEHVWKAGRTAITHNKFISDIDAITRELIVHLNNTIFKYEFFGFTAS